MKRDIYAPEDKDWKIQKDERNQVVIETDDNLNPKEEMEALNEATEKLEEIKDQNLENINNDRTNTNGEGSKYR